MTPKSDLTRGPEHAARRPLRLATLIAAAIAAATPAALGQQDELTGTITQSEGRLPLAVPPTIAAPGAPVSEAAEIGETLRADLEFSDWFGLLDPRGEGRIAPGQMNDAAAWRAVGAAYVASSRLEADGDRAVFTVRLVETGGGTDILHRTWQGRRPGDIRRLAHAAADAIVERLTGNPGIAGTRIAFVAQRDDAKEVYLMDYDGARVRRLTTSGTINLAPSWSPDGRRLAFLSFRGRRPTVYMLSDEGAVATIELAPADHHIAPEFSPDGGTLAYASNRGGNSEIYLYELRSGRERALTRHPAIDTAPSWSPDGRRIAFTSDRSGSPQIYLMNADGSDPRRISWEGRYNESAAWSPDGRRIAFVSRIAGRFEIVVHDLDTGREKIVTSGPGNKENPRWAPDGRHLVYAANPSGEYHIYTIRDDGKNPRRLTRGAPATMPDWSPPVR
jgi:TolB protein